MRTILLLCVLVIGCSGAEPAPSNLDAPLAKELRALLEVRSVSVRGHGPKTIYVIRDHHHVPKSLFAADLADQDPDIFAAEIDREYEAFLATVDAVQADEVAVLRSLAANGVSAVFKEGLLQSDLPIFNAAVEIVENNVGEEEKRLDMCRPFGAPLWAAAAGVKLEVRGLDTEESLAAANPVSDDGTIVLNKQAIESREDIMAAILADWLQSHDSVIVVIGQAHDIWDNLEATGVLVQYLEVDVQSLPRNTD